MNSYNVWHIIVYLVLAFCDGLLLRRSALEGTVGSKYFRLHLLSLLLLKTISIFFIFIQTHMTALILFNIDVLFILFQPYLWLMFSMDYVRPVRFVRIFMQHIILTVTVIAATLFEISTIRHLVVDNIDTTMDGLSTYFQYINGSLLYFIAFLYLLLGLLCLILVLRAFFKSTKMQRNSNIIIVVFFFLPWIIWMLSSSLKSDAYFELLYLFLFISCTTYFFAFLNDKLLFTVPIATETVFRRSTDAIILIDSNNFIVDANDSFLALYPQLRVLMRRRSTKTTFTEFLKNHFEIETEAEYNDIIRCKQIIGGTSKYFSARIEQINAEDGSGIGKVFILNDITLFVENEMKLEEMTSEALDKADMSELSLLQAQIKPHFLNNTLNVIASLIKINPHSAKELVVNLGEFLRNSYFYDSSRQMISLNEELEIIHTYVSIEKARFLERVQFEVVGDQIPELCLPRLILQPLVENAICHGILQKMEGGSVILKIKVINDLALFEVNDNGAGIPAHVLDGLLTKNEARQGLGIHNIHNRLKKVYGAGLIINSVVGQGTTVSFAIPLLSDILTDLVIKEDKTLKKLNVVR